MNFLNRHLRNDEGTGSSYLSQRVMGLLLGSEEKLANIKLTGVSLVTITETKDLFTLYVLLSHFRPRDGTLEN